MPKVSKCSAICTCKISGSYFSMPYVSQSFKAEFLLLMPEVANRALILPIFLAVINPTSNPNIVKCPIVLVY